MFNEICIYEAKLTKLDEIEALMKEVAEFYLKQDGVTILLYEFVVNSGLPVSLLSPSSAS